MPTSSTTDANRPAPPAPKQRLTLFDTTAIIVGVIVGSGLYETTPDVAGAVGSADRLMLVWVLGGIFSLIGSLCYAELATAYPRDGGDYVFLSRAYGRWAGFLFAWGQLWVVRPGSIGAMAYVFARYATELWPLGDRSFVVYATASVTVLSVVNILGVELGKWTQNALSVAKVLGLTALVVVGFVYGAREVAQAADAAAAPPANTNLLLAMILVMFTYGGWNDVSYVAAEVRDPRRNIWRALLLGTGTVTLIYVLVNGAFVRALGIEGFAASHAVAADVAALAAPTWGPRTISLLVCISTLGAINAMLLTGARIYYAFGRDHSLYQWLGRWDPRFGTPLRSLVVQAAITLGVMLGFAQLSEGTDAEKGFQQMVNFTLPLFWLFLFGSGVALLVLRRREPQVERPFRVPGYPVIPLLFCMGLAFMLYSSVTYAYRMRSIEALWSVGLIAAGILLAVLDARSARNAHPPID